MKSIIAALSIAIILTGCSEDRSGLRPTIPLSPGEALRGREIVTGLAACGVCHGESSSPEARLSGGRLVYDLYGEVQAANLTPASSGLGEWEARDLFRALRSQRSRDDRKLSPHVHKGMEWMSDRDVLAIASYLRTLAPVEKEVEKRSVSFVSRYTTGLFEGSSDLRGFVPGVDSRNQTAYGKYLVTSVARCTSCHNTQATLISAEGHLTGGTPVRREKGEKIAPDITASLVYGIGGWSEDAIVRYLGSGETPDHKIVDSDYCPVNFYARAPESDLRAMAVYLKTVGGTK